MMKNKKPKSVKNKKSSKNSPSFIGFSKLNLQQRYSKLMELGSLNRSDVQFLKKGGLKDMTLANHLIENVIGYLQLPLGVATHFVIDGKSIPIPMAIEETSIVAAASKTAKWISKHGSITTSCDQRWVTGQIQIHNVKNFSRLKQVVEENKEKWIQSIHEELMPSMVGRGGGVQGFELRQLNHDKGEMAILHIYANTCSSMGANTINQICEYLKNPLEDLTKERVSICILSNLADRCLVRARVVLNGLEESVMDRLEEASFFAEIDPYRAATSNKGVMNGIDAVLLATGNDWRAVEAGVHAYATRKGDYKSVTRWRKKGTQLIGEIEIPMMVGTVGGMTRIHPTSQICMKMMNVKTGEDLARICAAVGLVQNLGAIQALTTVGIIEGHMRLHIKNLTHDAGATSWEFPFIQKHLENVLRFKKQVSLTHAKEAIRFLRNRIRKVKNFRNQNRKELAYHSLNELLKSYKEPSARSK